MNKKTLERIRKSGICKNEVKRLEKMKKENPEEYVRYMVAMYELLRSFKNMRLDNFGKTMEGHWEGNVWVIEPVEDEA